MMKYLFSFLLFCLHGNPTNSPTQSSYKTLIVGRWRDISDHKSEIVFTKNYKIDYYNNQKMDSFTYKIKGDSLVTFDKIDSFYLYYDIDNLDKENLNLVYLARGNTLVYKRVKEGAIPPRKPFSNKKQ